jgi:hypothetical protein
MPEAEAGLLYHYTSEAGLQGIVENDNIWATDIHFLNDWTEFGHVFNEKSLGSFVESFLAALPTDIDRDARQITLDGVLSKRNFPILLDIIEGGPPHGRPKEAFICSFTADAIAGGNPGDRLSQWRGYSRSSQGFSLGFDSAFLKRQIETQNNHDDATAELVECIYDDEEKLSLFVDMGRAAAAAFLALRCSGEAVPKFNTHHPNPSDEYIKTTYYLEKSLTMITPLYYKAAAQVKHKGFAEEHEWRVVFHTFHKSLLPRLKHRKGQFGLTPFVELPLGLRKAETCSLRRIVVGPSSHVGPGSHQEDTKHSVELLLRKRGIDGVEVATSLIPYRSA